MTTQFQKPSYTPLSVSTPRPTATFRAPIKWAFLRPIMRRWIICIVALFTALEAASADDWRVSTSGFGPARIGMTLTEASQALRADLVTDGKIDSSECYYVKPKPAIKGLTIMVSRGRVLGFDVYEPGIKTLSGLGIGDTKARIIKVLGQSVKVTPLAPDGNYLTIWSSNRKFAVRFEMHLDKVTSFSTGQVPEAMHVEGCSY